MEKQDSTSFETILDSMLDVEKPFPAKYLHRFSDISRHDLASLEKIWNFIPDARKVSFLEDLEEISDSDTLTSFTDLGLFALNDPNPGVRELAIRLLWECEEHQLIARFMNVLRQDPDEHVRAAAANALGLFVYMGEMDKIPDEDLTAIQNLLIEKFDRANPQIIRRRAIESLGYSSLPEVDDLIRKAYAEPDKKMTASALFAMGRSANDAWADTVLSNLNSSNVDIQVEAIRAAGELELQSAREEMLELLDDGGLDLEVMLAAVWSLSQIGGQGVLDRLEELADDPDMDEETLEMIDSAIENLMFNDSLGNLSLMDIDEDPDED